LVRALNNVGASLAQNGQVAQSVTVFERALELDPGDQNVKRNLEMARQLQR
jgi:Flp pilus assembly protein TadD